MLIKNIRYIVTMDPQRRLIKDGAIFIEDNKIIDVGKNEIYKKYKTDDVIDAKGMVAMPGLIKAHTHSPMTLMRGYIDDLPLIEWLQKLWTFEAKLKPEDCYYGSLLACLEMISFGITTFSDMYLYPNEILKAVEKSGLRAMVSPLIFEKINKDCNLRNARKFLKKKTERVTPALGPHATYTCSKEELIGVANLAEEKDVFIHTHVSETQNEVKQIKEKYGTNPVEFLNSVGLLTDKTILVHAIWVTDKEIKLIAKTGAKIVHCPIANMKLASGVAPVHKMKNITVSIGSDGPSSNNNLDMFEEMKAAALIHKINNLDPTLIPSNYALEMATINGAKTLGLNDTGSLEPGKKADLILIDFRKPHLTPLYNPVSHLVYSCNGGDVDTTICNGEILMKNRKFVLDAGKIMKKVEEIKEDLLKR
ncbi:MAG: amidohydrolase [Candidatus Aenigmarchaeota archaeon]|nr:amidohydrolase [Candidatus Aenigmarchaeota archaeon]